MLMAGLDGIKNRIDPGSPRQDLYDLPKEENSNRSRRCGLAARGAEISQDPPLPQARRACSTTISSTAESN